MDAKYLEEIEERANNATDNGTGCRWEANLGFGTIEANGFVIARMRASCATQEWDNDFQFIANARQDIPALIVAVRSLTQSLEEERKAREMDAEAIEQTRVRAEAAEQALAEIKKAHALCGIRSMLEDAKIVMAEAKVWEPEYLKLKATLEYVGSELFKVAQGQKLDLMDLGVAINRALEPKENHG